MKTKQGAQKNLKRGKINLKGSKGQKIKRSREHKVKF